MANIVVTSNTDAVEAVFNDLAGASGMTKGSWPKSAITRVELLTDGVFVHMADGTHWTVSFDGGVGFQIDSVDAASPTSDSDLYDKLKALLTS